MNNIEMTIDSNSEEIGFNIEKQSGGTSNYTDLTNKPKINNVELSGNKTTSELGIVIPTNSDFTLSGLSEKSYNNLTDKPTIPSVPTTLSSFTDDLGTSPTHSHSQYLTQHQDISSKLDINKVKSSYSTTSGDVYDVSYINSTIGDIETLLGGI